MSAKIFIWEKEHIIALDIKNILVRAGYKPRIMRRSDDIFALIIKEKPELFILCPDFNYEITTQILHLVKRCNIPILILSYINKSEISRFINLTDCSFLLKPFGDKELLFRVKNQLDNNNSVFQTISSRVMNRKDTQGIKLFLN